MAKNKLSKTGGMRKILTKVFTPIKVLIYVALVVIIASVWAWVHYVYNDPERVFWGMIDNSLQTTNFTQKSLQNNGQQRSEQIAIVQTSPLQMVNSKTTTIVAGPPAANVVTESIGTPTTDFVRYTNVSINQKSADGKTLDFSSVLNKWGKTEISDPNMTNGQLYSQSVLGAIPFGKLNAEQRHKMVKYMRDNRAYTVVSSTKEKHGLRTVYNFKVSVEMVAYITALKEFSGDIGLTQLKDYDVSQYQSQGPETIELQVDGLSRSLTRVSYKKGIRIDTYSAYGMIKSLQGPPKDTISIEELTYKLQTIQ